MMILAALFLPQYYWQKGKDWRKAGAWREKWVRPEKLPALLSGRMHVIERETREPARRWREWRYYAPDGRMAAYEEVEGKRTAYPGTLTWRAGKMGLVIESAERAGKVFVYTVATRADGRVSYYYDEEGSAINGQLALRTVEVREGGAGGKH